MQVHISYLDHFIEALYISWPSQPLPQEVRACASKPGACHWKGSENRTRSLTKKCLSLFSQTPASPATSSHLNPFMKSFMVWVDQNGFLQRR